MDETKIPSLGEQRVRANFNPSANSRVDQIKQKTAELINLVDLCRYDENYTTSKGPEVIRLTALAQTAYEEAAMWAVKAATA